MSLCLSLISVHVLLLFQAIEQVLVTQISKYWPTLQQVLDDTSISNVQVKEDGHKVHGAILVSNSLGSILEWSNVFSLSFALS